MYDSNTNFDDNETLVDKHAIDAQKPLSYEYIRGLVEGEGCFSFSTSPRKATGEKYKIPSFTISMHERDLELLKMIKNTLGLKNRIYNHGPYTKDRFNRAKIVTLVVREFGSLKNIIIPLFYKCLKGNKGRQFQAWLEKIGSDPDVAPSFKLLYRLYKCGFYDKNPKFND